jgi:hypothetical protein
MPTGWKLMPKHHGLVHVSAYAKTFIGFIVAVLMSLPTSGLALAQDKEPSAVFQLGAVGEWSVPNGVSSFGPAAAIEFTAIKNWLEIEPGVTSLFSRGQTELDTDVLFKKPFAVSPTFEIEPGIGPQWIHTVGAGRTTDAIAAEAALDFMFWSTRERMVGWFLEPSCSYAISNGREQLLGVSVGLLISIQ